MNKIGIKLANGEFYPVLDDGLPAKKKLTLTTVKDDQRSVQIDVYRGRGATVLDAEYMGSLVIESIAAAPAGEPDIGLELELDEGGLLNATVVEPGSGEEQSLSVSLEALGEEAKYEIPDFDFEEDRTDTLPSEATSPEEGAGLLAAAAEVRDERQARSPWIYFLGILILLLLLALGWFIYQWVQPARAAASKPAAVVATAPAPAAATAPATPAPAATPAPPPAPVAMAATPTPKPEAAAPPAGSGLHYKIKWGDTLWDLAWVYYRDPWLYPRIAKANKIRNPDLILAGTYINIPPR